MPRRAAFVAVVGAWAIGAASARATDFPVTAVGDSGAGTLRQAVSDANASAATSNTITFTVPASSTITLSSDLDAVKTETLAFIDTTEAVTIDANDAILFQNADTAHFFTFSNLVTYRDGKIIFTEATNGTIGGTLNGTDVVLTKAGAGTTTVNGTIDLEPTSIVNVDDGTLVVNGSLLDAGTLDVAGPATLHVASGGTVSAGALTADGTIDVDGTLNATSSLLVGPGGTLLVEGTVNAAGKTITDNGSLVANGTLTAGSLVIGSGGVLTGSSTAINAPVNVSGRVAPSTATGTLGITGPVSFGSTSTYEADMGPGGAGDSITATGAVTIAPGARLALVTDPNAFGATPSSKTILSGSSLSGQFNATDYAFFDEDYAYGANSLTVTLTKTSQDFTQFARTPNQVAVAGALDAAAPGASGDLQTVFDALYASKASEIAPLLDAIGGESLTAFATARQILAERTSRALHRRVRDPVWGSGRAVYASEPTDTPDVAAGGDEDAEYESTPPPSRVRPGVWFDGLGLFGRLRGDTGEADVDTLLYGATLGGDATIADHYVVGLAAGYARSDVELDGRDADVFGDTVQGALYAGYVDPRGYLSLYGRYAYSFETSRREIESSALSRRARASFDAQDYGVGGELGFTVLSLGGVSLQPIAGVDWLRMDEDSFTEHGANSLDLIVHPETLESTTSRFGGRLFGLLDMDKAGKFVPELRAFYQHLHGDRERVLDARLSGAPGLGSIGVRGAGFPHSTVILGFGWGVLVGANLTVSIDYDALLGSDRVEHQGTIAARVLF
jgi:fibronectin-binding autotransporter adhesin